MQPSKPKHYRVRTRDQRLFAVARWSVTDSTLVIEEFDRESDLEKDVPGDSLPVPYALDLADVSSIEQLAVPGEGEMTILVISVVLVAVWLLFMYGFAAPGG